VNFSLVIIANASKKSKQILSVISIIKRKIPFLPPFYIKNRLFALFLHRFVQKQPRKQTKKGRDIRTPFSG
jgi:hypothetical protein